MNKEEIKLYDYYYYNTTGAYNKSISLRCRVIDIGVNFIWVLCDGNLGPSFVKPSELSIQAKFKITNNFRSEIDIKPFINGGEV